MEQIRKAAQEAELAFASSLSVISDMYRERMVRAGSYIISCDPYTAHKYGSELRFYFNAIEHIINKMKVTS